MEKTTNTIVAVKSLGNNKHSIDINGNSYGNKKSTENLGAKLINALYWHNNSNSGIGKLSVIVDNKDCTADFKSDVIEKYRNTGLSHFCELLGE